MARSWNRRLLVAALLAGATVTGWSATVRAGGPVQGGAPEPPVPHIDTTAPIAQLVTMGEGDDLFEKFGHAALCLTWPGRNHSLCYNYGTTDFDSVVPLFWGFLRGRSLFWVSVSSRPAMLDAYRASDRTIWNQVLSLRPDQTRRLARLLAHDARPEHRYYRYNHYTDNCSTRLRDLIDRVTGGALSRPRPGAPDIEEPTYRELTRRGFAGQTGLLLLSDLLLGHAVDHRPSRYQAMFLPEVLRREVAARLGDPPRQLYTRHGHGFPRDPGLGGRWVWLVLAALVAAPVALSRWRGWRHRRLALALSVAPLTLIGLLLWTVAVVSPLHELRWNEALLVFMPTDVALPFLGPALARRYAATRVAVLLVVSLLRVLGLFTQPIWWLIPIPLIALLIVALGLQSQGRAPGAGGTRDLSGPPESDAT